MPLLRPAVSVGEGLSPVGAGPDPPVSPPVSVGPTTTTLVSVDNEPSLFCRTMVVVELVLPFEVVLEVFEVEFPGAEVMVVFLEVCVVVGTVELVVAVVVLAVGSGLCDPVWMLEVVLFVFVTEVEFWPSTGSA